MVCTDVFRRIPQLHFDHGIVSVYPGIVQSYYGGGFSDRSLFFAH